MKHLHAVTFLVMLVLSLPLIRVSAQAARPSGAAARSFLSLTRADNGRRLTATAGQTIQVDVQSHDPAAYDPPQVSSPSVRYLNSSQAMPPNPGGFMPLFVFEAVSPGVAEIRIPRHDSPGFSATVEVRAATRTTGTLLRLDQSNTDDSGAGWTNLVNRAVQIFTPELPRLVRVEVQLVEANPGAKGDAITMTLLNPQKQPMVIAEKILAADQPGWIPFVFANGGLEVAPGDAYGIQVNGTTRFGWKYVAKGYIKGEALFNGQPLLKGAHSSFLFKTFGTN